MIIYELCNGKLPVLQDCMISTIDEICNGKIENFSLFVSSQAELKNFFDVFTCEHVLLHPFGKDICIKYRGNSCFHGSKLAIDTQ